MMEDFIAILPPFLRPCSRLENKTAFTAFVLQQNVEKRLLELLHSAVLCHVVSSFFPPLFLKCKDGANRNFNQF